MARAGRGAAVSDGTHISWTDATLNVVTGCAKVSPGCYHCYAIRTAHRLAANPNPKVSGAYFGLERDGEWTGRVNLRPDLLDQPFRWRKPRRVFVTAQGDLFHTAVPDDFIARVWAVMALTPQHTYQVLTKRHGRMRSLLSSDAFRDLMARDGMPYPRSALWRWSDVSWPLPNVHLLVSVEDQARADLRIPALLDTPAAVRGVSCEPLLGPVDLRLIDYYDPDSIDPATGRKVCGGCSGVVGIAHEPACGREPGEWRGIDWVIAGGESGPGARPMHPDWARSLRDQCVAARVPFFFKQWGEWTADPEVAGDRDPDGMVLRDGRVQGKGDECWFSETIGAVPMARVGKRAAGDLLDGCTWHEQPGEQP